MGQTGGHKISDLVFLPLISFILSFRVLECIKRYWKPYVMSLDSWSDLPLDHPLWVKLGSSNSRLCIFAFYLLCSCF